MFLGNSFTVPNIVNLPGQIGGGVTAGFSYDKSSYNQGEANPTPTITGTTGGVFSSDAGLVFVSTSTGEINLSASTIASHTIFYTVDEVQASQTIDIVAAPYQSTSSFTFDGINDYFDLGQIDITGTKSVSFWIYPTASGDDGGIFSMAASGASSDFLSIGLWQSNIQAVTQVGYKQRSTQTISVNNWYHIVIVKTTNSIDNIYINGVNQTLDSAGSWNGTLDNPQSKLGEATFSGSSFNYTGNIDELSIWNTALSSDAVTEIYNSGAPNDLTSLTNASNTNLKAWYKF
jgi:hypothetical protein